MEDVASHSLVGLRRNVNLIQGAQEMPACAPGEGTAVLRHLADEQYMAQFNHC